MTERPGTGIEPGSLKHVFVIGVPRSGTTWTMLLLSQHPAVAALQQSDLFGVLRPLESWWKHVGEYGHNVVGYSTAGHFRIDLGAVLAPEDFYSLAWPLATRVFEGVARTKAGARVIVEQTPEHAGLGDLILKIFPQAYFLHVIRDPRSVFCSLRNASHAWKGSQNLPSRPIDAARFWLSYLEQGQSIASATPNYREVRYETLIEDGPAELGRLFSWLGLPWDRELCEEAMKRCSIETLRGGGAIAPAKFFRRGEIEAWRQEASPAEIRCIEFLSRKPMERLGYRLAYAPSSIPLRFRVNERLFTALRHAAKGLGGPVLRWLRRLIGPVR